MLWQTRIVNVQIGISDMDTHNRTAGYCNHGGWLRRVCSIYTSVVGVEGNHWSLTCSFNEDFDLY